MSKLQLAILIAYMVTSLTFMWAQLLTTPQPIWLEVLGWIGLVNATAMIITRLLDRKEKIHAWLFSDYFEKMKPRYWFTLATQATATICLGTWFVAIMNRSIESGSLL